MASWTGCDTGGCSGDRRGDRWPVGSSGPCSADWDVTACERAASLELVGAGLALAPNGLRALDLIGAGDALRALAVPQELGIRVGTGLLLV